MQPGDPSGPPEETINCRCTVVSVLKGLKGSDACRKLQERVGKKAMEDFDSERVARGREKLEMMNSVDSKTKKDIINVGGDAVNILPRAEKAVIPIEKLTKYALDPDGDRNKAVAFELALGYNIDNVDKLISQIKENLSNYPAVMKGNKGFGEIYEVKMDIIGENGKKANVLTGWIDDIENGEVRLITVHVD
jgi:hypothetical protein